jgi:hypothetical protein
MPREKTPSDRRQRVFHGPPSIPDGELAGAVICTLLCTAAKSDSRYASKESDLLCSLSPMAQTQIERSALASNGSPVARNGHVSLEPVDRVRELIAGRHSKAALQLAKDLHKREASADSEALLIEAYRARIEDLIKLRMTVEAKALIAIVRERFPAAVPGLAQFEWELSLLDGHLDHILGPLRDPSLAAEDRERIEATLRQKVGNLAAVAGAASLPPNHPVRQAASALRAAFQAVTQGPVDEQLIALPEVSRRSPLASWKALVRAIDCYYRYADGECKNWLATISADSVPARLIPSIRRLLGEQIDSPLTPAESHLVEAAGDRGATLRSSLAELESRFAAKVRQPILHAVRAVRTASIGLDAALRERLRQHMAVRCIMQHISPYAADQALGGTPVQDAYFFRLLARALEEANSEESSAEAVLVWDEFRGAAIRERWFAPGSLEDGVLALHMADLVAKLPDDVIEEVQECSIGFSDRGKVGNNARPISAARLYERACQADPNPGAFAAWLDWANKHENARMADDVADRWRKWQPAEVQPLLHLIESAERRNAFTKALDYLAEAEKLDRLNPAVRRAKVRILLSAAFRQLRKRKAHLVSAEIDRLLTVPELRPGEVAALATALRWCSAAVDSNNALRQQCTEELVGSLGSVAAAVLLSACIRSAQLGTKVLAPSIEARHSAPADLLAGTIRACMIGDWAGLPIPLHFEWKHKLIAALQKHKGSSDATQLLVLGETALSDGFDELAYAVSSAGLARGDARARFLFLRSRALPGWMLNRREGCLRAALQLAWSERDTDLAGKALDRLSGRFFTPDSQSDLLPSDLLNEIIREELGYKKYPALPRDDWPRYSAKLSPKTGDQCDCPVCRAERGETGDDWGDGEEDDARQENEEDLDGSPFLGLPPPLLAALGVLPPGERKKILKAMAAGEDPIKVLDRIEEALRKLSAQRDWGDSTENPWARSNPRRQGKSVPANETEQGRLF